jgi:5'-nucleotidase
MRKFGSLVAAVALALLAGCSASPTPPQLPNSELSAGSALHIVHVNDRHGRMDADPYVADIARQLKSEYNVLILDAGDTFHGQPPSNLTEGAAMAALMNAVGYSAMAPGNHDFNFGYERLLELQEMLNFPILAANIFTADGDLLFQPHKLFEFPDGLKVGVIGLATPETPSKTSPEHVAGLTFTLPADAARESVVELKAAGAEIIIALAHLGDGEDSVAEFRSEALINIPGIDVIVDGHSHSYLHGGIWYLGNNTEVLDVQTGAFAEHLGIVNAFLTAGSTQWDISAQTLIIPTTDDAGATVNPDDLTPDPTIVELIAKLQADVSDLTSTAVGNSPVELEGRREVVRVEDSNLGDVITDSMRWATGADFAFLTGGNIRASIPAGEITMAEVLTTLPFSNLLVTLELSGAAVLEALEHGLADWPNAAGSRIHVSGIEVIFEGAAPAGSRVRKVLMPDGTELDPAATYTVVTTEFLLAGGDGYEILQTGVNWVYFGGDAEALADYLGTSPTISPSPEGRISLITR